MYSHHHGRPSASVAVVDVSVAAVSSLPLTEDVVDGAMSSFSVMSTACRLDDTLPTCRRRLAADADPTLDEDGVNAVLLQTPLEDAAA